MSAVPLPTTLGQSIPRVEAACQQVIAQLTPLAASMVGSTEAEWVRGGWRSAHGRFVSLEDLAMEMVKAGEPAAHAQVTLNMPRTGGLGYCAQAAEVEVDPETGQVRLGKIATAQDVGTVLNALGHQGQIEGAVVQGVGYALLEELVLDQGRIDTNHLGDYKLPTARDIPKLVAVNLPSTGLGPYNARAIGELPTVPTAAAIANAVADAIGAPIFQLPITAERVIAALETTGSTTP